MNDELDRPKFKLLGEKAVRFDIPPVPEVKAEPSRGGLIDLFRAWLAQAPEDRRTMARHKSATSHVWLGWKRSDNAFFANPARLVNISRGGALLYVADPPPEKYPVWICLGEPDPSDCLEATVLEVRTVRRKRCAVRIVFHEPCPHLFFEAAVCIMGPSSSLSAAPADMSDGD